MNHEEKKSAPEGELKDEGLKEVSGGIGWGSVYYVECCCPTCNHRTRGIPGRRCELCALRGVESYLVKLSSLGER